MIDYCSFRRIALFLAGACVSLLGTQVRAADEQILWPSETVKPVQTDGKKAFQLKTEPGGMKVSFSDGKDSDDYIHIDLGPLNLTPYADGGYVEIEAEATESILRLCPVVSDPGKFWDERQIVEGGALMKKGRQTYRFYLDVLSKDRPTASKDHLYVFLQDLGGSARGNAEVKITKVALHPMEPGWEAAKRAAYAGQYAWPEMEHIEDAYYEDFSKAVIWKQVATDPFQQRLSLNGMWTRKDFGERTWDQGFLRDSRFSQDDLKETGGWKEVQVPEPMEPDQVGGHVWYRREFTLPKDFPKGRVFLRFDDIADEAVIYLNGKRIGTQASTEKRLDWVVENGARSLQGKPVKETVTWQHFDRCSIPFPFDAAAIPSDTNRLILPIYSGKYVWPYAYDVTSALLPGRNTLAVRTYGNPMRGWWIFRHRDEDRAAKNIFGILGNVTLAGIANPQIKRFTRVPATAVNDQGLAVHGLQCDLEPSSTARKVEFTCGDQRKTVDVAAQETRAVAEFPVEARFADHRVTATVAESAGEVLDQQSFSFNGAVADIKDGQLRLNGEPFLVRGINSNPGVEWANDRSLTRREFQRLLRQYQQLGLNAIRIEGVEMWQMEEAFHHGMMVVPVTAAGSCNWSISALGNLLNPDFQFACDRQKVLAVLLNEAPNLLLWNGGNEIHHTPGYVDKPLIQEYLRKIERAFQETDPSRRMVTYANLDTWAKNWFFFDGQEVLGWNIYERPPVFEQQWKEISAQAGGRPIIFTEWGTLNGVKDRVGHLDEWEDAIRKKWSLISSEPQSAGGFFFPFHGEMEDQRGLEFMRALLLPFVIQREERSLVVTNRDRAAMRDVNLLVVNGTDVSRGGGVAEIKPGETVKIPLAADAKGTIELRYDTHRGLKHFYTQQL